MSALTPTEPEPACDIRAQLAALLDPTHPKRAVWLAHGTPLPELDYPRGLQCRVFADRGMLIAASHDCDRLADDPSEETLSIILDYTEPKSGIIAQPAMWWPVVQARDARGCVIWEQIASWQRVLDAMTRADRYSPQRWIVLTMDAVLQRRARLIAEEARAAAR